MKADPMMSANIWSDLMGSDSMMSNVMGPDPTIPITPTAPTNPTTPTTPTAPTTESWQQALPYWLCAASSRPSRFIGGVLRNTDMIACSVAASYKPPMLVTRVRPPACAFDPTDKHLTNQPDQSNIDRSDEHATDGNNLKVRISESIQFQWKGVDSETLAGLSETQPGNINPEKPHGRSR